MLKVVVILQSRQMHDPKFKAVYEKLPIQILSVCEPGSDALLAIEKFKPDLVINSVESAKELQQKFSGSEAGPRLSIMSSTHQGIQLVAIADVDFFQAGDKYVTAYHNKGELLIEDTLTSLEVEFAQIFVRIHRKNLVAIAKIEKLFRTEDGQHYITLRGYTQHFQVSRRQLPKVRKILLCK